MDERRTVLGLRLSYFFWGVFWGAWGVLLPLFKSNSNLTDGQIGTALSGISVGAIPAMLFGARLFERSPRFALQVLLCAFAAVAILLSQSVNFISFLLLLVLLGVASGLLDVALNVNVSNAELRHKRRLFQSMHGVFPLGVIIAAPLTGIGRDAGWSALQIFGLVSLLALVPVVLLGRTAQAAIHRTSEGAGQSRLQPIVDILKDRALLVVTALIIVFLFLEHSVEQWSALFIEQAYGSQASISSLAPCLYMFTLFAGRMLVHRIEHKVGFARLLQVGAIGTTVLLVGVACSRSLYLSLAAFACMGLLMAPLVPGLYAWISKNTEERLRVRALSGVTALSYLGYLLSPLVFGGASSAGGLYQGWFAMALVSGLSLFVVLLESSRLSRPVKAIETVSLGESK